MFTSKKFRAIAITAIVLGFLAFLFWPVMMARTSSPNPPAVQPEAAR